MSDSEARLRLVEKDVDRHERELRSVENVAGAARETAASALRGVAKVSAALEGLARQQFSSAAAVDGEDDEAEPIPCWLTLDDPARAREILAELVEWIEAVYLRYPGGDQNPGAYLTDCWLWHSSVVEELRALRDAWLAAYEGERRSAQAVMDWHDRHRPGTARRVRDELSGCSLSRHKADGALAYRPARAPGTDMAAELVDWWTSSHGDTAAPAPSAAMLAAERAKTDRR